MGPYNPWAVTGWRLPQKTLTHTHPLHVCHTSYGYLDVCNVKFRCVVRIMTEMAGKSFYHQIARLIPDGFFLTKHILLSPQKEELSAYLCYVHVKTWHALFLSQSTCLALSALRKNDCFHCWTWQQLPSFFPEFARWLHSKKGQSHGLEYWVPLWILWHSSNVWLREAEMFRMHVHCL